MDAWDEAFWRAEIIAIADTSGGQWQQALRYGERHKGTNARAAHLNAAIDGLLGRLTTEYTPVLQRLNPQ